MVRHFTEKYGFKDFLTFHAYLLFSHGGKYYEKHINLGAVLLFFEHPMEVFDNVCKLLGSVTVL